MLLGTSKKIRHIDLNCTHQLLVSPVDANLLCKNITKKIAVVRGKEIWVEVNAEETKHMFMFHEWNVGQKGKPGYSL